MKVLAPGADRSARLKSLGKALDRHAEEIETHAADVEPSATALRTELHAITSELRTVAARAQSSGTVKDGPALRETAIELGARASISSRAACTDNFIPKIMVCMLEKDFYTRTSLSRFRIIFLDENAVDFKWQVPLAWRARHWSHLN